MQNGLEVRVSHWESPVGPTPNLSPRQRAGLSNLRRFRWRRQFRLTTTTTTCPRWRGHRSFSLLGWPRTKHRPSHLRWFRSRRFLRLRHHLRWGPQALTWLEGWCQGKARYIGTLSLSLSLIGCLTFSITYQTKVFTFYSFNVLFSCLYCTTIVLVLKSYWMFLYWSSTFFNFHFGPSCLIFILTMPSVCIH